ncbi:16794_t:CDS:2, partial [Racocetra fulgida]
EARLIMQLGAKHDEYWNAFDNATSHTVIAPDALVAARMNLYPDGKQPKMRITIWNGKPQTMVYPDDYENPFLRSQPKRIKAFLEERDLNITNCCTRCLVANQPDFLAEHGLIQKEIEKR